MLAAGEPLPVSFAGRVIYYVGPVQAAGDEAAGPAGPTTANRMDAMTGMMLEQGLLAMIGKAERGPQAIAAIARHGAAYMVAVGGAAVLVSRAIRAARVVGFADLGMDAIHEFAVEDMPVTVAVDARGALVHASGPRRWQGFTCPEWRRSDTRTGGFRHKDVTGRPPMRRDATDAAKSCVVPGLSPRNCFTAGLLRPHHMS